MNKLNHILLSSLLSIVLLLSTALVACGDKASNVQVIQQGSTVIALGDSLTYGYGTTTEQAYPALLAQQTGWNVINAGVNGDTSAQVLARLDDIIAQQPKLVLLGIGGNDVLRKVDSQTTKNNIIQIIQKLKAHQIQVVLIAQPHLSVSALFGQASDNPIYQDIAEQEKVALFAKEWSRILSDDSLKSDKIHANQRGYAEFSQNLAKYLAKQGYYQQR